MLGGRDIKVTKIWSLLSEFTMVRHVDTKPPAICLAQSGYSIHLLPNLMTKRNN